jgi:hypothetical protein
VIENRPESSHLCNAKTAIVFRPNYSISGCNSEVRHFGPALMKTPALGAIAA